MKWGIKDILSMSDYRKEHFWGDLFRGVVTPTKSHNSPKDRDRHALNVATYMVTRAMELAWQEMITEGTEICFFTKKRVPFMIFFIKDFKYVSRLYVPNMKFRGNKNKFKVFVFPSLLKRAKLKYIDSWLEYFLYLDISLAVQRKGMDYPAMPDWNVYKDMRKPYIDHSSVQL